MSDKGSRHFRTAAVYYLFKLFAILSGINRLGASANQFYLIFFQSAILGKGNRSVECGLSAQCRQQRIGAFLFNNRRHHLRGYRLNIGSVRHLRIGHNGCRVGVNQNDSQPFRFEHAASLAPGIVKFAGLADLNRPGTNN